MSALGNWHGDPSLRPAAPCFVKEGLPSDLWAVCGPWWPSRGGTNSRQVLITSRWALPCRRQISIFPFWSRGLSVKILHGLLINRWPIDSPAADGPSLMCPAYLLMGATQLCSRRSPAPGGRSCWRCSNFLKIGCVSQIHITLVVCSSRRQLLMDDTANAIQVFARVLFAQGVHKSWSFSVEALLFSAYPQETFGNVWRYVFPCHNLGGSIVAGIYWVEAREAAMHSSWHRTAPPATKGLLLFSSSFVSDSVQPCGPWPARLCSCNSPGKNTRVGCHFLLQRLFLTQRSNPHLLHWQVDSFSLSHWEAPQQRITWHQISVVSRLRNRYVILKYTQIQYKAQFYNITDLRGFLSSCYWSKFTLNNSFMISYSLSAIITETWKFL